MAYKEWKLLIRRHTSPLPSAYTLEEDFPTVDFRKMYRLGMEPARAAEIAKSVNAFTKSEYKSA